MRRAGFDSCVVVVVVVVFMFVFAFAVPCGV
jgi:hypothetical protein